MTRRLTTAGALLLLALIITPALCVGQNGTGRKKAVPARAANTAQGGLPSARQLLDNHLRATGGVGVRSYVIKGSLSGFEQGKIVAEFYKDGEKELAKVVFPSGEQEVEFYDGQGGWRREPDQDVVELGGSSSEDPESVGLYLKFLFFLNSGKDLLGEYEAVQVTGPTKLNTRDAYVVEGKIKGGGLDKFYFDKQGGVLLQSQAFDEANKLTSEFVWSDYRTVGGKQVPHKLQVTESARTFAIEAAEINVSPKIDPTIFDRPED